MQRVFALLFALAMFFAVGCEPPAADDGGGDGDANTTMNIRTMDNDIELIS